MLSNNMLEVHLKGIQYCMEEIECILNDKDASIDSDTESKLFKHYYNAMKLHVKALVGHIKEAEAK